MFCILINLFFVEEYRHNDLENREGYEYHHFTKYEVC